MGSGYVLLSRLLRGAEAMVSAGRDARWAQSHGCPLHQGTGKASGPGSAGGAGSSSSGNLDAKVNVCPDEGC